MEGRHLTLAQLRQIRGDLLCTKAIALQTGLLDAHAARAHQLVDKIADAPTVVGRLTESEGRDRVVGALVAALTAATYSTTWDLCTANDE